MSGVAAFDATTFKWWNSADWHANAFESMSGSPHEHVTIFQSDASDGLWLRTRGMIKFVRSDISIHKINGEYYD